MSRALANIDHVARRIFTLRGERVLLGPDLARLYGVEIRALTQAVQRNRTRFPADFMFQLDAGEWENLKSQFVISSGWRDKKMGRESLLSDLHEIKNPDPFSSPHLSFNLRHLAIN